MATKPDPDDERQASNLDLSRYGLVKPVSKEPEIVPSKPELAAKAQELNIELKYKEPYWSQAPSLPFELDVIKDGILIENLKISSKGAYLVGKIPLCDIMLEHPVRTVVFFYPEHRFSNNKVVTLFIFR